MADMVLSGVVRKLADIAGNLIVKEGSRLFKLKENILWIEDEMKCIQSYLEDADAIQPGSRGLTDLIRIMWDLAYDVEDIMDAYFPKLSPLGRNNRKGCLGWFSNAKTARDFALEIEEIRRRVEEISRRRQTYQAQDTSGRAERDTWDPRRSFPHIEEVNVVGLDEHIVELVAKVSDEDLEHRVVSITGMAGLGKTTLAKKVFNSVRQRFQCSAWIYVSQQPNVNELLQDIARQVGLTEKERKHNLVGNLFHFLSRNRYVLVLDDIWRIEPWNALKNGIPLSSMIGSRIIITSRYKYIGIQIGGQNFLHELQPLGQENSRKLFFKMVMAALLNTVEGSDPSELENIGEKILKRCGGVPLAIVVTAGLLLAREKTKHAWQGVLKSMGQDEDQCSKIFALSYQDLPSELKPCFLYFGLFPEDHEISAFKIINLWAAEGFIRRRGPRAVEDLGQDYLNHLVGRNLIQVAERRFNGTVRLFRIHDILHDLCIRKAREINFFNTLNDVGTCADWLTAHRVSIHQSDVGNSVSSGYQTLKLRALLCFSDLTKLSRNQVKNLIRGFKFLRVLSLMSKNIPRSFENEIVNFKHLHHLELGVGGIELPYTISNLKCLLTLDLRKCYSVILPNVIWKMKQLRHILLPLRCCARSVCGLNLDRFHPFEVSLPNLQTLYGLPAKDFEAEWLHKLDSLRTLKVNHTTERIIEILSGASPLSQRLEVLHLLSLSYTKHTIGAGGYSTSRSTLDLSQYVNLGKLHLVLDIGHFLQLDKLPMYITELSLRCTGLKIDPMVSLRKLPKLKILMLGSNSYNGKEMVCSGGTGSFPQLEVLKIELLFLKEIVIEEGGMPKLKDLTFIECSPRITVPDRMRNTILFAKGRDNWFGHEISGHVPDP
ncbi:toMV susceptible protein tm-2-like [Diospyros lotus]|uniref:toMV susceptible protein tm-2-like n=1 Tax=Diospyros lotus TaxID=55363 RepID=UPI002254EE82|nr:toMV susceptible protein tm-2-like [Diospyros lotus]XP_052199494.1 toMV susceptible protein tm-2-like [Diospyros lotus]XP_052199495.1 toMV susceptible protein tm-2-like [Diospyros lotus]